MLIKSYSEIVQNTINYQQRFINENTQIESNSINRNIINGEHSRIIGDKFEVEVFYELLSNITNRKRPSLIKINKMTKKARISARLILNHVSFNPEKIKYYQSKCGKEGLPWDIALLGNSKTMNISLKHRNCKIKHQRPIWLHGRFHRNSPEWRIVIPFLAITLTTFSHSFSSSLRSAKLLR